MLAHLLRHLLLTVFGHLGEFAELKRGERNSIRPEKVFRLDIERFGQLQDTGRVGQALAPLKFIQTLLGDIAEALRENFKTEAPQHARSADTIVNHRDLLVDEFCKKLY